MSKTNQRNISAIAYGRQLAIAASTVRTHHTNSHGNLVTMVTKGHSVSRLKRPKKPRHWPKYVTGLCVGWDSIARHHLESSARINRRKTAERE